MNSQHWITERKKRDQLVKRIGWNYEVKRLIIDKNHRNGKEIHVITDTGLVYIFNQRTGKRITVLIARPGQLKRYWGDEKVPEKLMSIAKEHVEKGYNRV